MDTSQIAALIAERVKPAAPFFVGISGGVASGKSTFAAELAAELESLGRRAQVISLDGYLKPNAVLQAANLMHRKGFPDSFDFVRLIADVERLRAGHPVHAPHYDHAANDVVETTTTIDPTGVLILEGVVALEPQIASHLDFKIFLDTDLELARTRYEARAQRVAAQDKSHPLNTIPEEHRLSVLKMVWVEVNLKNFTDHIAPTKATADVIVSKLSTDGIA